MQYIKPEISTLISKGGAGAISAQAGEVLTLMATSMSDDEWESFVDEKQDAFAIACESALEDIQ